MKQSQNSLHDLVASDRGNRLCGADAAKMLDGRSSRDKEVVLTLNPSIL